MTSLGKGIAVIGLILLVSGGLMMLLGRAGVGPLPGDIAFRKGNVSVYFPIGTSILLSVVLTILLNVFFRR